MEHPERLETILKSYGKVAIAFSGGVDSTFLLRVASDVLPDKSVLALTIDTPLIPRQELELSQKIAQQLSVEQILVQFDPFSIAEFRQNTAQRCYYCKKAMFAALQTVAAERGFNILLDGSNADDVGVYRPGRQAAAELKVQSPLEAAGFTKAEIRRVSRELGLITWDLPSMPCLATRFPYDTELTLAKICRVEQGEEVLRKCGLQELRLRDHGMTARLEVPTSQFDVVLRQKEVIIEKLKSLGYKYIVLDLEGYRSGSFDRVEKEKQ